MKKPPNSFNCSKQRKQVCMRHKIIVTSNNMKIYHLLLNALPTKILTLNTYVQKTRSCRWVKPFPEILQVQIE